MRSHETIQTIQILSNKEASKLAENHLFDSKLFNAIERARFYNSRYSDLTFSPREIKNEKNGKIEGLVVELSWDIGRKKHRTSKIMAYPDGLLEFGFDTVTAYGRSSLSRKTWEEMPGKVWDNLLKLMRHSPKIKNSK